MMRGKVIAFLFLVINLSVAFYQNNRFAQLTTKWMRSTEVAVSKMKLSMASLQPSSNQSSKRVDDSQKVAKQYKPDLSSYTVGQELTGRVVSLHPFGVFVGVDKGLNVLLPKSKLGKQYDQLKNILENNPTETVKISLTDISPETGKLAGIIVKENKKGNAAQEKDEIWEALREKNLVGKSFETTVVGVHAFGLFVKLEEFNVEGLVPVSKLPVKENLREIYPRGSKLSVTVEDVSVESKKMILSAVPKPDVRAFANFPEDKWTQAVIQNVNSFGLFVRPAGHDVVGLVRRNQIPQDLIYALRNILELDRRNLTVLDEMFGAGDVVRVRLEKLDIDGGKVEFSMIPKVRDEETEIDNGDDPSWREGLSLDEIARIEEEEAEFVKEWRNTKKGKEFIPEVEGDGLIEEAAAAVAPAAKAESDEDDEDDDKDFVATFNEPKKRARKIKSEDGYDDEGQGDDDDEEDESVDYGDDEEEDNYDPLSTLVWWRGKPFEASAYFDEVDFDEDDEDEEDGSTTEGLDEDDDDDDEDEYENEEDLFMEDIDEAVADQFSEAPWITESPHMVQGAWKRLLTLDFEVADEANRKEREREEDRREIEAEIGAMKGFDVMMAEALPSPYLSNFESSKFGCYVDFDQFPEWKEKSEWYKKYEAPLHTQVEKIRWGKKNQLEIWDSDLDEFEKAEELALAAANAPAKEEPKSVESKEPIVEEEESEEDDSAPADEPKIIESSQTIDPIISETEGAPAESP